MAKISQGFEVLSKQPIDFRLLLANKAAMLTVNDNLMPQVYFTVCIEDGKFYIYNKTNPVDTVTGKFRLVDEQVLSNTTLIETALSNSVKFTTLETKVGDAEAGTGLAGDVKVLQQDVVELKTDVNVLKPEVAQLKQEVEGDTGLAKRVQQLEGRLTDAEERMDEIEERIAAIKLENIPGTLDGGVVTGE